MPACGILRPQCELCTVMAPGKMAERLHGINSEDHIDENNLPKVDYTFPLTD